MATFPSAGHAMYGGQQYPPEAFQDSSSASPALNLQNDDRNPLGNLGLLKNLGPEKKQTKDGQPPKRRGPKPDSKPALTRRQELNRQAQRLERPCMDHMQYLMVRSHNPDAQPFHHPMENADDAAHAHMSGHALMASGVPYDHIMRAPADPYTPPSDARELKKLLDISGRLPFSRNGEITPIMAWFMLFEAARFAELDAPDLERIKRDLAGKVHCYGFGAVLEEFEVHDAMSIVLQEKGATPMVY